MFEQGVNYSQVDEIEYPLALFVFHGFDDEEKKRLSLEVVARGAMVDSFLSEDTNYLVVGEKEGAESSLMAGLKGLTEESFQAKFLTAKRYRELSEQERERELIRRDTPKEKPKLRLPESIPSGGGNMDFDRISCCIMGIKGREKSKMVDTISAAGGVIMDYCDETRYLICDPSKIEDQKMWRALRSRELEGNLVLMTPLLFDFWTDPTLKFEKRLSEEKFYLAVHFLSHEEAWEHDKFGNKEKIEDYLINNPHEIIRYLARRKFYAETENYYNWLRRPGHESWGDKIRFEGMRLAERIGLAVNYLKNREEWNQENYLVITKLKEFLKGAAPTIIAELDKREHIGEVALYLDWLNEMEKTEWNDSGYSDGFYTFNYVKDYCERSIAEKNVDKIAFYLNYKDSHYDADFVSAAEMNEMDVEFGIAERPDVYRGIGTVMEFGRYPQSSPRHMDPIEWDVIAREGTRVLLISRMGLDVRQFNREAKSVTWEKSTLRKWLHTDFMEKAFTEEERCRIVRTVNINPKNYYQDSLGGNDTEDDIFVLSLEEAEDYLPREEDRSRKATPYTRRRGAEMDGSDCCYWWLRTAGMGRNYAAGVRNTGKIDEGGRYVHSSIFCVCPSVWIETAGDSVW